jgi:hypothetical protein
LRRTIHRANDVRIIYYNCVHRHVFDNDPHWDVSKLTVRVVDPAVLIRPRTGSDRAVWEKS